MADSLVSLYPNSFFFRKTVITPRGIYLIIIMGDFKGNWLGWNSDITRATFCKEHFGRKYAECKGIFNVKKMPNPILLTEAFSLFYICVCVYIRIVIIFIVIGLYFPSMNINSFPCTCLILRFFHPKMILLSSQQINQVLGRFPFSQSNF